MTLSESIKVTASLEQVWPFVADPVGQATWNQKIVDVHRRSTQAVRVGERFSLTYRMSNKARHSEVEVIACDPPREVHFRHNYQWNDRHFYADERYTLRPMEHQVEVTQYLDMRNTGIPWFFRAVIWLISRVGKPVDMSSMERLKEAVEQSVAQTAKV